MQLLTTTTFMRHADLLARLGVETVSVEYLDAASVAAMVTALSEQMHRSLPPGIADTLGSRPRSALWVQLAFAHLTALDETVFSQVEQVSDVSHILADTAARMPDPEPALVNVLYDRIELDNPGALTPVVSAVNTSRSGLTMLDIAELTGLDAVAIARVRRGFGRLLAPSGPGGRLEFTHDVVRKTLAERYATEATDLTRDSWTSGTPRGR